MDIRVPLWPAGRGAAERARRHGRVPAPHGKGCQRQTKQAPTPHGAGL